ncbi:FAD-binding protein [Scytonema sp. UIC 10036]|uniref:FAD-binding oxidoreductase n=1 Tax=Scytonema sp. UIC 10036 TaxID=2304196 RepID=UPI0012DAE9F4|nr:FAD-binding oxidoreductase [Scytonema sp. UIC 10036]MUG94686.1 FAD-binding protein [Scytonema sp. UIC 10036]
MNKPWESIPVERQKSILEAIASSSPPGCMVSPDTIEELAAVIAEAYSQKQRVLLCGSGSKLNWGGLAKGIDVVVSTERINQLLEHAVGDFTVTVEAGMKFSDLQKILANSKQFLAIDPTSPTSATVGGIVATADTGSLRQRYGSVRDQILGITFVRSDGKIAKAGGRVVKNVAGYDLMKLFTGSFGTLGAIAQVTFRLYPFLEASGTVVLVGDASAVSQAADTLRGSALTPTQSDLLSLQLVSGLGLGQGLGLMVRFQSIAESVKEQSNQLLEVGKQFGLRGMVYSGTDEADLWLRLGERIHDFHTSPAITCKIGVLPISAVEVLTRSELGWIHVASGLGVLRFEGEKVDKVLEMRNLCQRNGGFLTVLVAPRRVKGSLDVWGYGGNALELMRRIKEQFDSGYIFSPGRFVGGI